MTSSGVKTLSLGDVDDRIRGYEEKYRMTTAEFLRSESVRSLVPEDDILKWEAAVDFRRELREMHAQVHREYLRKLRTATGKAAKTPASQDEVDLAA